MCAASDRICTVIKQSLHRSGKKRGYYRENGQSHNRHARNGAVQCAIDKLCGWYVCIYKYWRCRTRSAILAHIMEIIFRISHVDPGRTGCAYTPESRKHKHAHACDAFDDDMCTPYGRPSCCVRFPSCGLCTCVCLCVCISHSVRLCGSQATKATEEVTEKIHA